MKETGAADITGLRGDWVKHKNEMEAIVYAQDTKLARVEVAE